MPKMTDREFEACYEVGKRFHANEISREDGIIELVDGYQMNKNSAEMYMQFFKYMMNGKKYTQSINMNGLIYYLDNVLNEYGEEQLKIFLQGLELHIKYRQEELKLPSPSFCDIYNKYSKDLGLPQKF